MAFNADPIVEKMLDGDIDSATALAKQQLLENFESKWEVMGDFWTCGHCGVLVADAQRKVHDLFHAELEMTQHVLGHVIERDALYAAQEIADRLVAKKPKSHCTNPLHNH